MTPRQATLRAAGTVVLAASGHQLITGRAGVLGASAIARTPRGAAVGDRNLDSELRFYAAWYTVGGLLMHKAANDSTFDRQVSAHISAGWGLAAASRLLSLRAVGRPAPLFMVLAAAELALACVLARAPKQQV